MMDIVMVEEDRMRRSPTTKKFVVIFHVNQVWTLLHLQVTADPGYRLLCLYSQGMLRTNFGTQGVGWNKCSSLL
jgi:hypothetical protein